MAKAINWPIEFRDEVIQESTEKKCAAFRIGRLYFDNAYWVPGETVDIRVNHKIIRKAVIQEAMKACLLSDLTPQDYDCQKASLNTMAAVIEYLSATYDQLVTMDTEISVVYYQNLPIDPELMEANDDPHLT